jgi:hypothetical protein
MTQDEKRERLLKRILPGLVIGVVYFTFLSSWVTAGAGKAKTDLEALQSRGVLPGALDSLTQQQRQLNEEIRRLNAQKSAFDQKLSEQAGFLSDPNYANYLSDKVSAALVAHRLREVGSETLANPQDTPAAIQEVFRRLPPPPGKKGRLSIWRISFVGFYPDTYRMLNELAELQPPIIPAALDMKPAPDDRMGMAWTLSFWAGAAETAEEAQADAHKNPNIKTR